MVKECYKGIIVHILVAGKRLICNNFLLIKSINNPYQSCHLNKSLCLMWNTDLIHIVRIGSSQTNAMTYSFDSLPVVEAQRPYINKLVTMN